MTREELMAQLIENIKDMGIDFRETPLEGPAACVDIIRSCGAYDISRVTPFDLAHEMIHIANQDDLRRCDYDVMNPAEKEANKAAVKWLWEEFLDYGGTTDYVQLFIEVTGCPDDLVYRVVEKMTL